MNQDAPLHVNNKNSTTLRPTYLFFLSILLTACQPAAQQEQQPANTGTVDTIFALAPPPEAPTAPPLPPIDYDSSAWTELYRLDRSIIIDMKYATTENFVEEKMYDCSRCFLRPPVAEAVVKAHKQLQQQGLGLKMLDCFRPRPVQWQLWKKVPNPRYVADPRKGSMHNRGVAVDLTIVDADGEELPMGTPYDFFGPEAAPAYTDLPEEVLQNRQLLRETMIAHGFKPIRSEWWHFSYSGKNYALSDMLWKCY